MVEAVDQSLGRIRAKLQQLGLEDNTIIVFTSDNGSRARGEGGGVPTHCEDTKPRLGKEGNACLVSCIGLSVFLLMPPTQA